MNDLTQVQAEALIAMEKQRADDEEWEYPGLGSAISIPLVSPDGRERFLLDIRRGRIDLKRSTYQNRYRQVIVLVRLDYGGPPHRNPDDRVIPAPHLHIYREGYADKWAQPVPECFGNLQDDQQRLTDFMRFCHVTQPPRIEWGLF